jgi:hypothetical protein
MLLVTRHLCYEILSLILFPLLPPLAIVIVVIIVIFHLMIIASLSLPFCNRSILATPSPQSQWQIVSFFWGGYGHNIETPLLKAIFCQLLIVVYLLSIVSDETPMPPPQKSPHRDEDGRRGRIVTPPSPPVRPQPPPLFPRTPAWLLLLLFPTLFLSCLAAGLHGR